MNKELGVWIVGIALVTVAAVVQIVKSSYRH